MPRKLSSDFMAALKSKGGLLNPLLERVREDHTLDLEIRDDEIHIYYRGGKLFGVKKNGGSYRYTPQDKKYRGPRAIAAPITIGRLHALIKKISDMKEAMNRYFATKKAGNEREFQQLMVRENNYSRISNGTDYFIADIEYSVIKSRRFKEKGLRYDALAIQWDSRKKSVGSLAICEMKYGLNVASLYQHTKNILLRFPGSVACLKDDAVVLFQQKRELGLVIFDKKGNPNQVKKLNDGVDLLFILANVDPATSKLKSEILKIKKAGLDADLRTLGCKIKIGHAHYYGYGLYKDQMMTLDDFIKAKGW